MKYYINEKATYEIQKEDGSVVDKFRLKYSAIMNLPMLKEIHKCELKIVKRK